MESISTYKEIERFAERFSSRLSPGDVVGLTGEMGIGKTTLVKLIAKHFGILKVSSPSFLLLKQYPAKNGFTLIHADLYRLKKPNMFYIELEEYLNSKDYLVIIEWAEKISDLLPSKTKWLKLIKKGDKRYIKER